MTRRCWLRVRARRAVACAAPTFLAQYALVSVLVGGRLFVLECWRLSVRSSDEADVEREGMC
jgi:hypothetical protein